MMSVAARIQNIKKNKPGQAFRQCIDITKFSQMKVQIFHQQIFMPENLKRADFFLSS